MKKQILFILTDDDGCIKSFAQDAQKAVELADAEGLYAAAYIIDYGDAKTARGQFWEATMDLTSHEITTAQVDYYKYGSDAEPCRHGFSSLGRAIQDNDTSVAWGATAEQARVRVMKTYEEAVRRSRRDNARRQIEADAREQNDVCWDPYGLWIDRVDGLRDKIKQETEAAYNQPVEPLRAI